MGWGNLFLKHASLIRICDLLQLLFLEEAPSFGGDNFADIYPPLMRAVETLFQNMHGALEYVISFSYCALRKHCLSVVIILLNLALPLRGLRSPVPVLSRKAGVHVLSL